MGESVGLTLALQNALRCGLGLLCGGSTHTYVGSFVARTWLELFEA